MDLEPVDTTEVDESFVVGWKFPQGDQPADYTATDVDDWHLQAIDAGAYADPHSWVHHIRRNPDFRAIITGLDPQIGGAMLGALADIAFESIEDTPNVALIAQTWAVVIAGAAATGLVFPPTLVAQLNALTTATAMPSSMLMPEAAQ